jgi:hypothetical protein
VNNAGKLSPMSSVRSVTHVAGCTGPAAQQREGEGSLIHIAT